MVVRRNTVGATILDVPQRESGTQRLSREGILSSVWPQCLLSTPQLGTLDSVFQVYAHRMVSFNFLRLARRMGTYLFFVKCNLAGPTKHTLPRLPGT